MMDRTDKETFPPKTGSPKEQDRVQPSLLLRPSSEPAWLGQECTFMPIAVKTEEHVAKSGGDGLSKDHSQKETEDHIRKELEDHIRKELEDHIRKELEDHIRKDTEDQSDEDSDSIDENDLQDKFQALLLEEKSSRESVFTTEVSQGDPDTRGDSDYLTRTQEKLNPPPPPSSHAFAELLPELIPEGKEKIAENPSPASLESTDVAEFRENPIFSHWFFKDGDESKETWHPFSLRDSSVIEEFYQKGLKHKLEEVMIPVIGGRYDVNVINRNMVALYWNEGIKSISRCSWFYKPEGSIYYLPYDEATATELERHYRRCEGENRWNRRVLVNDGLVSFEGPESITRQVPDISIDGKLNVEIIYRGIPNQIIFPPDEKVEVDHLVFVLPGIGSVCDLHFRSVTQCVDGMRDIANKLLPLHFKSAFDSGVISRVEFLPVEWHDSLHEMNTNFDKLMKPITLPSISVLRNFMNDTLLDILLYNSPWYCQTIVLTVTKRLNKLYKIFVERNPSFHGSVSVVGHSLGSLILFDLFTNQPSLSEQKCSKMATVIEKNMDVKLLPSGDANSPLSTPEEHSSGLVYPGNQPCTTLSSVDFPQLRFNVKCCFALGSPIAMFLVVRGYSKIDKDFCFPACNFFYNIFHPYDPVAYRIEPLIDPSFADKDPVLIPHHKGRKRFHRELGEKISKMSTDVRDKFLSSLKYTWGTTFQYFGYEKQLDETEHVEGGKAETKKSEPSKKKPSSESLPQLGAALNDYGRIDYVLQEKPIEALNEYIFALSSHMTYWTSEDTVLMILKEIYADRNCRVPLVRTGEIYRPPDPLHHKVIKMDKLHDNYKLLCPTQETNQDTSINNNIPGEYTPSIDSSKKSQSVRPKRRSSDMHCECKCHVVSQLFESERKSFEHLQEDVQSSGQNYLPLAEAKASTLPAETPTTSYGGARPKVRSSKVHQDGDQRQKAVGPPLSGFVKKSPFIKPKKKR